MPNNPAGNTERNNYTNIINNTIRSKKSRTKQLQPPNTSALLPSHDHRSSNHTTVNDQSQLISAYSCQVLMSITLHNLPQSELSNRLHNKLFIRVLIKQKVLLIIHQTKKSYPRLHPTNAETSPLDAAILPRLHYTRCHHKSTHMNTTALLKLTNQTNTAYNDTVMEPKGLFSRQTCQTPIR